MNGSSHKITAAAWSMNKIIPVSIALHMWYRVFTFQSTDIVAPKSIKIILVSIALILWFYEIIQVSQCFMLNVP